MDNFEAAVYRGLGSLPPGAVLLAAVSGGADSSAMLAALARLRDTEGGFILRVVHVEHGIRPAGESRGDAVAVQSLCAALNVPCRVVHVPPGKIAGYSKRRGTGIEAAARHFRYRILRRVALRSGALIVVAHTRDDALELGLMRTLRGSGPAGLARMPSSRNIFGVVILRPLLALSRGDVESYLAGRNITWRSDATNRNEEYLRNRVRLHLVPLLEKHFSGWKQGLEALGDTQSLAAEFIQAEARCRVIWEGAGEELRTPAENFFAQPLIIREEALFQALNKRGVPPTVAVKRRTVRCFANREMGEADLGFCRISVTGQEDAAYIRIFRPRGAVEAGFSLLIKEPGLYKLRSDMSRGLTLAVSEGPACECQAPLQGGAAGFFIGIPFVLRNARGDDVLVRQGGKRLSPKEPALAGDGKARDTVVYTAQDAAGVAAFIGVCPGGIVILRRETVLNEKLFSCDIGGIDAQ